jgi:uncharacterized membrane protein
VDALSDFIKNAGLFTLLHLLVTAILILIAIVLSFSARARSTKWWWLVIGIVPAVSGILLWYLRNRALDRGIGLMSHVMGDVLEGRREARINLLFGLAGTTVILFLTVWRRRLNRKSV